MPHGGVDLLLTLNTKRDKVLGRHGRIFHTDDGWLAVAVPEKKAIYINGTKKLENARWIVRSPRTGLSIGNLTFSLEFTDFSVYRAQLNTLLSQWHGGHVHLSLDPTPKLSHFELDGFMIQEPVDSGGHGVVLGGVDCDTGKAVAVKRVQRTSRKFDRIQLEIQISKRVGNHVSFSPCTEERQADNGSQISATWSPRGTLGEKPHG